MDVKNITSSKAATMLKELSNSILIDVRTHGEWQERGVPDIEVKRLLFLTWRTAPDMNINPVFKTRLISFQSDYTALLFFICKSGKRSFEAASYSTSLGYKNCYNIIDGFEGGIDGLGWKHNNLPYKVL